MAESEATREEHVDEGQAKRDFRDVATDEQKADKSLAEAIGDLYAKLPEDKIPELADHLDEMKDVQNRAMDVVGALGEAIAHAEAVEDDNERYKQANVKLMYQQVTNADRAAAAEEQSADDEMKAALEQAEANMDEED